jgi:maleylpyruvate isomerase
MDRTLYTYFRSSASYRVRIALNLKSLSAHHLPIHLTRGGGEQFNAAFKAVNPSRLVPVLLDDGLQISQSLAILEYLEERYPTTTPLLPSGLGERARARQLALIVACDIHPLNNLRVLKYLSGPLAVSEAAKLDWIGHWLGIGLSAMESELTAAGSGEGFCVGDSPTIADCCLIPQLFNARRFNVDLTPYPTMRRIEERCQALKAFQDAHPSAQIDAE